MTPPGCSPLRMPLKRKNTSGAFVLVAALVGAWSLRTTDAVAAEHGEGATPAPLRDDAKPPSPDLRLSSDDGNFVAQIGLRLQLRYTYDDAAAAAPLSSFRVRRARVKVEGNGFAPWFRYFLEYDFPSNSLLDARVSVERFKALRLRAGQWKVEFNRERVDSSGKQQLVDRSIVNALFTLDRQTGVEVYGELFEGSAAYLQYGVGAFTGAGLNEPANDDAHLLWLAHLQWNFLGRKVEHTQSDPTFTSPAVSAVGLSVATNRTDRVRFPQTDGLGAPGQFRIEQAGENFVVRFQGLSLQQEAHVKVVRDLNNHSVTRSQGGYVQAGVFPNRAFRFIPPALELAGRYALVDPDVSRVGDFQREFTVGANWFFAEHRNKLSADYAWVLRTDSGVEQVFRAQWDVSF